MAGSGYDGNSQVVEVVVTPHLWDEHLRSADEVGEDIAATLHPGDSLVVSRLPQPGDPAMPTDRSRTYARPASLGDYPMAALPQEAVVVRPIRLGTNGPIRVLVTSAPSVRHLWRLSTLRRTSDSFIRATSQGVALLLEEPVVVELQGRPHRAATKWTTLVDVELFWDATPTNKRHAVATKVGAQDARIGEIEQRLHRYFHASEHLVDPYDYFTCALAVMAVSPRAERLEMVVAESLANLGRACSTNRCGTWSGWARVVNALQRVVSPREYRDLAPELDVSDYLLSSLPELRTLEGLQADRAVETSRTIAQFLARRGLFPPSLLDAARRGFAPGVAS